MSGSVQWILTLRNIDARDSGRYTCRVWNSAGEISFDYTLRVVGELINFKLSKMEKMAEIILGVQLKPKKIQIFSNGQKSLSLTVSCLQFFEI